MADDLGSPCLIGGLQVPEYPLYASCSEWGVIALLANVHVCPSTVASPHPGRPAKPSRTLPPWPILPLPNSTPPPRLSTQPTSSSKSLPPITSSLLFHIPRGALVKSNPIIRHSAVQEKKENFPLVNSRLPFFFFPPLFSPQVEARWHFGPPRPVVFVFLHWWFSLSSFLLLPYSLSVFC